MASARHIALDRKTYASSENYIYNCILSFQSDLDEQSHAGKLAMTLKQGDDSKDKSKKVDSSKLSTDEADLGTPEVPSLSTPPSRFSATLTFRSFVEFDTTVEIQIVQFWPHLSKSDRQSSRVVVITGNSASTPHPITFESVSQTGAEWHHRYGLSREEFLNLHSAVASHMSGLWEIQIPVDGKLLSYQNLFSVNEAREHPFWVKLRQFVKQGCGVFRVLIQAPDIETTVKTINQDLIAIKCHDPLGAWKRFIQTGMFKDKTQPPRVKLGAFNTFPTFDHYLTVVGLAAVQEQEYRNQLSLPFLAHLRVLEMPGSNGSTYFGFLTNLPENTRLNAGDGIQICPGDTSKVVDDLAWSGFVMHPLPFAGMNDISVVLYRRQFNGKWDDVDVGQPVNIKDLDTFAEARTAITSAPAIPSSLRICNPSTSHNLQLSSLRQLTDNTHGSLSLERMVLLGNRPSELPSLQLYGETMMHPKFSKMESLMHSQLNDAQKIAAMACKDLPGGICIIEGPPGTGKTFLGNHIIQPLLCLQEKETRRPILLVSASNRSTDMLATRLQETTQQTLQAMDIHDPPMIIRMYPPAVEDMVVKAEAEIARPKDESRLRRFEDDLPDLGQMSAAQLFMDHYNEATRRPIPGVFDQRVKDLSLTLGFRMLQMSGFETTPFATKGDPEHREFRRMFINYRRGEQFTEDENVRFTELIDKLRIATLKRAHAIVTTPTTVGRFKLREAIHPNVILIDEAARINEADLWHSFAWFPGAIRIFLGDTRQLRPFVHPLNDLHAQASVSLMCRLARAGYRTIQLTEQHRYGAEICKVISEIWYDGLLTTAPRLLASPPPEDLLFRSWSRKLFGIESQILCINTKDSVAVKDVFHSYLNKQNARLGGAVIRSLLREGVQPKHIGILCAYQAQFNLYSRVLSQIQQEFPKQDLRAIRNEKIDGFQGDEIAIMIIDLSASAVLGFLRDGHRLNTALSRGRSGVILLLNHQGLTNDRKYRRSDLQAVVITLRKDRKFISIGQDGIASRFTDLQPELIRAAGFEESTEDIPMTDSTAGFTGEDGNSCGG